jgi:2-polyprenyl-3-methyl-5-hydroxy-6-metoxy-1,4-benzoquinol methylase
MNSKQDPRELQIISSWYSNAQAWSNAIATASIASRKLVTNQAIVDAVASVSPRRVLDIGCGEGWLARALSALGMNVVGIDVVPDLIARAGALRGAEFQVCDYESIAKRQWRAEPFDAIVCNFSLLGRDSVESMIAALPGYLNDSGYLIIQTLHPIAACGGHSYQDGWREGSWLGFSSDFNDPAPWYFRTIESWSALLQRCDFDILECREPCAVDAVTPASIIWIGKAGCSAQTRGRRLE